MYLPCLGNFEMYLLTKNFCFGSYDERESKNNLYNKNKYKVSQFCKTWSTDEPDFILTLKQYLQHQNPEVEKPDLFMNPIPNPAKEVWYNKTHKVSEARCAHFLKGMVSIIGIDSSCFSNKSGRATLVTRMATLGVPNEIGMMITGHHSADGYSRYDSTQELKMEAANLVSRTLQLGWTNAMEVVSKNFMEERYVGSVDKLTPPLTDGRSDALVPVVQEKQVSFCWSACFWLFRSVLDFLGFCS
jgi:hypothetical protein